MTTQGIERIPDSLGYLVLTDEGAVISSGGDLENDEPVANQICKIVHTAAGIPVTSDRKDSFKRISRAYHWKLAHEEDLKSALVIWDDFMYMITVSNQKIFVCKRNYVPQDPVVT